MTLAWLRAWPPLAFTHRWLGVAGCLLFVLWFASGIAMVYARMPELTDAERLAAAAPLAVDRILVAPGDALRAAAADAATAIHVRMLRDRPVYVIGSGAQTIVYADSGEVLPPVSVDAALDSARTFAAAHANEVRHAATLAIPDQWTLQLRQHLPLHRFAIAGPAGAELYVSSRTGEVVLDTTRRERWLAYIGPVAHWLYLPVLRRNGALWTQVVIWASAAGCVLCLTGLLAGVWRYSPRRGFRVRGAPAASPYDGWLQWHHYAGLLFGVLTFTWTFSGLLSMGPFAPLSHQGLGPPVETALAGTLVEPMSLSAADVRAAAEALRAGSAPKEMRLLAFHGERFWTGRADAAGHRLVPATAPGRPFDAFSRAAVEQVTRQAGPADVVDLAWLSEYDEYYYDRGGARPLPVLRARFADAAATWTYVDPAQGAAVLTIGRRDRVNRWLYHGLHSLDPRWLRDRRPLWDLVVIALSVGGLAGAVTSLVPAWRRVRAATRRRA